jgi:hypothetical protein
MSETSTSDKGLSEEEKRLVEKIGETVDIDYIDFKKLVSTKIFVTNSNGMKREYSKIQYKTTEKESQKLNTLMTKLSDTAKEESKNANTLFKEGKFEKAQVAAEQAMKSAAEARAVGDQAQKLWEEGGTPCTKTMHEEGGLSI